MIGALVLKSTGFAGLGDLLLALERALLVTLVTRRHLVVDWRDTPYSRSDINLPDHLFQLFGVQQLPSAVLSTAMGMVVPSAWQGSLDLPFREVYASHCTDNWNRAWASAELDAGLAAFNTDAPWVVLWDHCGFSLQDAALRHPGVPVPFPLHEYLQPVPHLLEAIDAFRRQYFRQQMIGVHLRASAEAVRAGKSADLDQVWLRVDQLLADHPDCGVFLASDNVSAIEAMKTRYPSVLTRPKWLPVADAPLHLTASSEPAGLDIAADALIEMELLAACDWLIHPAQSSFSLAAARLSGISGSRLIPIGTKSPVPKRLSRLRSFYRRIALSSAWGRLRALHCL